MSERSEISGSKDHYFLRYELHGSYLWHERYSLYYKMTGKNQKQPSPMPPKPRSRGFTPRRTSHKEIVEKPDSLQKTRTPFCRDSGFRYYLSPITYHLFLVHVTAVSAAGWHRRRLFLLRFICDQSFGGNKK